MSAMTIAAVMLLAAKPACSYPGMVPDFWPHVVRQESGYDPLALHDDDTGQSWHPQTIESAEALAQELMAVGHSVGVGLSQLTARSESQFRAKFGLSVRDALDACRNMAVGARFYVRGALSIYNSGSPTAAPRYALAVTSTIDAKTTEPTTSVIPAQHQAASQEWAELEDRPAASPDITFGDIDNERN